MMCFSSFSPTRPKNSLKPTILSHFVTVTYSGKRSSIACWVFASRRASLPAFSFVVSGESDSSVSAENLRLAVIRLGCFYGIKKLTVRVLPDTDDADIPFGCVSFSGKNRRYSKITVELYVGVIRRYVHAKKGRTIRKMFAKTIAHELTHARQWILGVYDNTPEGIAEDEHVDAVGVSRIVRHGVVKNHGELPGRTDRDNLIDHPGRDEDSDIFETVRGCAAWLSERRGGRLPLGLTVGSRLVTHHTRCPRNVKSG